MVDGWAKAINADDLLEALRKRAYIPNGHAEVTLRNNAPSEWDVVVLAAGVKFFYRDGSEFVDGPREVLLPVGAAAAFKGNSATGCVYQYVAALQVRVGDEAPATITLQDGVPSGRCLLRGLLELRLQSSVSEGAMISARRADRLGLIVLA